MNNLKTNRSMWKLLFLGLITLGIYDLVIWCEMVNDVNTICSKYDGKKTTHYLLMAWILTPLTAGIYGLWWYHTISNRMGEELKRRGIDYSFSSSTFWLWNILGSLILVGPFVYQHKFCTAMNLLAADYNAKG